MNQDDKISEILELVRYNHRVLQGERRRRQIKSILILIVAVVVIIIAVSWYLNNKENISLFFSTLQDRANQIQNITTEANRLLDIVR